MKYLAIDTSGKNLTIIVCKDGVTSKIFDKECGVNHSVELMPKLEELIEKTNFKLEDADFFACVVGAGSFTGIRIGVATVKALAFAFNKPCLSITSFDTLAYNEQGRVLAIIDAKHNGFYVCGYENNKVILEPAYIMREQVLELIKDYSIVVSSDTIEGMDVKIVSVCDGLVKAIENKKDCISTDLETLTPLYVRKSQAEEGR